MCVCVCVCVCICGVYVCDSKIFFKIMEATYNSIISKATK